MSDLKLIAFDSDDLNVISAHLQDAVARISDMAYLPREKRFALLINRFDWESAIEAAAGPAGKVLKRKRCGLRFERVLAVRQQGVPIQDKKAALALLALGFAPSADAGAADGDVTLTFSGGAVIRLKVECLEAEMKDLGAEWAARRVPTHQGDED